MNYAIWPSSKILKNDTIYSLLTQTRTRYFLTANGHYAIKHEHKYLNEILIYSSTQEYD